MSRESEPSVDDVVTELIGWARDRTRDGPVSRFERWIREEPERGWEVLRQLVARVPLDAEVMFQTAFRVPQLLQRDFSYRDRVLALLKESRYLDALIGPELFIEAEYGPRYGEPEQLAEIWLRHARAADTLHPLERRIVDDHGSRVRFAVELVERGPLHGLHTDDVDGPLLDVLRRFGDAVIGDIEAAARRSIAVRRAIWSVRHQGPGKLSPDLWARFQGAAGDTNICNSRLPGGEAHGMEPAMEELLRAWFAHRTTYWAWEEVQHLVWKEPENGWRAIVAIVAGATSQDELAGCGAGPLEDLIRAQPARFIDRVEDLAGRSEALRDALAAAWVTLADVPESLARRYVKASGDRLKVLDAPEGWAAD